MWKILLEVTKHTLFKVILGILLYSLVGAVLVILFEGSINDQFSAISDAVWWVLVTMTTVGYGDKVPMTPGGKTVGVFIMLFGVALLSIFTATAEMTHRLIKANRDVLKLTTAFCLALEGE